MERRQAGNQSGRKAIRQEIGVPAGRQRDGQAGRKAGWVGSYAGRQEGGQAAMQEGRLDREEGHDQEKREGQGRIRAEHTQLKKESLTEIPT